jgi:transglutaminase-like putative cysteine protease
MSAVDRISSAGPVQLSASAALSDSRLGRLGATDRPTVRIATFTALALYGVLRWATLTKPAPGLRLVGMLLLAVLIVGLGAIVLPALADRAWYGGWHRVSWMARGWWQRGLVAFLVLLCFCAMLALAGIPVSWLYRVRVEAIANGIGNGLSALPGVLVPYLGVNPWVRIVISLGPGLLLLGSALAVCTRSPSELRRAVAALQLSALVVIPAMVMHPLLPYLQGLLLFALVAAFMWGERVVSRRSGAALAVIAAAALFATLLASPLSQHHPWFNYQSLAGSLEPTHLETFDWTQRYGPYNWPRDGRTVMTVKARRPDYWKAENLDVFDGVAWSQGPGPVSASPPAPASSNLQRWTQRLTVSMEAIRTTTVIAAGTASRPQHIGPTVSPGQSAGTWTTNQPLSSGETYTVSTYSPQPSAAQLDAIPATAYPDAALANYRVVGLPAQRSSFSSTPQIDFPPFHSAGPVLNMTEPYGAIGERLVRQSPYARAYALASSLAAQSVTPYQFVKAVERYLSTANGFSYDEHVPQYRFPLETFLFGNKHGYCQQFAGAMALLLRMGGIPARVATGFTTGIYDSAAREYVISDRDAHAWVEVWFPRYGWVRFNPTPASAPAISGGGSLLGGTNGQHRSTRSVTARRGAAGAHAAGHQTAGSGSGSPAVVAIVLPALALVLLAGLGAVWFRGGRDGPDELVVELERALARCGRPTSGGVTLRALERRFRDSPGAARYMRRLRLARFGAITELPTGSERRALRAQLASGLGITGWARAWWALPPRRPGRGVQAGAHESESGGLN